MRGFRIVRLFNEQRVSGSYGFPVGWTPPKIATQHTTQAGILQHKTPDVLLSCPDHFFEISIADDPHRSKRIELQEIVVTRNKERGFRLYCNFEKVIIVGISACLDSSLRRDKLRFSMDESKHDCATLRPYDFFDPRPRKDVSDFSDLPCIGDNFNFAVLNQGEKISNPLSEKEADPEIRINDCSHGQPEPSGPLSPPR